MTHMSFGKMTVRGCNADECFRGSNFIDTVLTIGAEHSDISKNNKDYCLRWPKTQVLESQLR